MPRRVQDIVPNNHRSIRDIPVERNRGQVSAPQSKEKTIIKSKAQISELRPSSKEKPGHELVLSKEIKSEKNEKIEEVETNLKRISVTPPHPRKKKSGGVKWLIVFIGIIVIVAGAGYVASVYFSRATFTLQPQVVPISINSTYIAQSASAKSSLSYELAVVKNSASVTVPAIDGSSVSTAAKGKVTVYNAFSTVSQRLIAGTRLSDTSGRIYRITSTITIPGYTGTAGSVIPGKIIADVAADQPGPSYNITRTDTISDLKIVAYKGTSKYESMYARLSSDISGGFIGKKKTISPTVMSSSTATLQSQITAQLLDQVKDGIPEGYIMYDSGYVTSFGTPVISGDDPNSAIITIQGSLYGIIFKKTELVNRIAGEAAVDQFDNFSYDTPGLEMLEFSIANQKDFSPEKKNTLIIKLKGEALLVGSIPVSELKDKLVGLSLTQTRSVLSKYKPVINIEKSTGEVTPPWSKVPSDPSRITVRVVVDSN